MSEIIPPQNPDPAPDPAPARAKCPECGAEFEGVSVLHASETLSTLREQVATLTRELETEKAKHPDPPPPDPAPPAPPDPAPAPVKRRMGFAKKRSKRAQ